MNTIEQPINHRAPRETPRPRRVGLWSICRRQGVLVHPRGMEIDLTVVRSRVDVLDRLAELSTKSWSTREDLADLAAAMRAFFRYELRHTLKPAPPVTIYPPREAGR